MPLLLLLFLALAMPNSLLAVTSDQELEQIFELGIRRDVDLNLNVGNSNYITKDVFIDHIIIMI